MGLAGYYIRFIEGFSRISHLVTSLQNKGVKFKWTSKCEEIFQHLMNLLTSAPILNIVDPNEYFIMCTNDCREGMLMFCSFRQVLSHGLGVEHVRIFVDTRFHFRLGENALRMKLGLHGIDDGICGLLLGFHTHMEELNILI